MKELRCFVFTGREVAAAVGAYRRKRRDSLPQGRVDGVRFRTDGSVSTLLDIVSDTGPLQTVAVPEETMVAMLVSWCIDQKIPLPADARKNLSVINGILSLMVSRNFARPLRPAGAD